MTIIALILIIVSLVFLIKCKNKFVVLSSNVKKCMSEVNTAKAKYLEVQRKALGLAGKATNNEGKVYQEIKNSAGQISSDKLLALGQMYPDLKDKFSTAASLSDRLYNDYRIAQTQLNNAITEYNQEISVVPQNIAAFLWGYKQETLIDEENLDRSKELTMVDDIDVEDFI